MLTVGVAVMYLIVVPRRRCLQCDRSISVAASRCRGRGYRYAAGGLLDPAELDR